MGFLGSFFSGVCSAIGSVCSVIGGAIAATLSTVAVALAPIIAVALPIIKAVATLCNILKPNEKPEDLGRAMEQAAKKPEDFASKNAYIDYLRGEIQAGRIDLSRPITDIEKAADTSVGCGLTMRAIDEKYGIKTSAEFWGTMGTAFKDGKITDKEVVSILETTGEKNMDINNVGVYIERKPELANSEKASDISSNIETALKKSNPEMSDADISARFNELLKRD